MKILRYVLAIGCAFYISSIGCKKGHTLPEGDSNNPPITDNEGGDENKDDEAVVDIAETNLLRAVELMDNAIAAHFNGPEMAMARYYNPYTKMRSEETGSIWMYTSVIEATNAILRALKASKEHGNNILYDQHYEKYLKLLDKLVENADYYLGNFQLISYTQTKEWSVYGVNRSGSKGHAKVAGKENVYDDQQWFIRELLEAYKLTDDTRFLEKAEYLTTYVLDGWDCTRDANGNEIGGITWGPGYTTKHSCSNGPFISSLVWLSELYSDKTDLITHRFIDPIDRKTRREEQVKKSDYYLEFAQKIYAWQKSYLLRGDGVYDDMMGGCTPGSPQTEVVDGKSYRVGIGCRDRVGPAITYNSGSMLSGAADLYKRTGNEDYLIDGRKLSDASFRYFAKSGAELAGYYSYDLSGFRNWFNGILMRAWVEIYPEYENVASYIQSFQENLDYGFDHFFYEGFLPSNLLVGWNKNNNENRIEGMFSFTFAAEYAILARYELEK